MTAALAAASGWAGAPAGLATDIPPGALAPALALFAERTGIRIVYVSSLAAAQTTRGARAGGTAAEALTALLEGTGLDYEYLNARTVRIFRRAAPRTAEPPPARRPDAIAPLEAVPGLALR